MAPPQRQEMQRLDLTADLPMVVARVRRASVCMCMLLSLPSLSPSLNALPVPSISPCLLNLMLISHLMPFLFPVL